MGSHAVGCQGAQCGGVLVASIFQVVKAWLAPPLLFDNAYAQMLAFQDQDVHTEVSVLLHSWLVDRLWNSFRLGKLCAVPMHCLGDTVLIDVLVGGGSSSCLAFSEQREDQTVYFPSGTGVLMSSSGCRWLNWKKRRRTSVYPLVV